MDSEKPEDTGNLALRGGRQAVGCGPFDWPVPDEEVLQALEKAHRDGTWGRYHGPQSERLIERMTARQGVRHVQLTCSGTFAVELALRAAGVQSGDEVLLAGYDFPGNFRAIEAVGARPVLIDLQQETWCLDVDRLEKSLASPGALGEIRAIIASHLHGCLVPMKRLAELANRHGWAIVEDACQVPGAEVDGKPAGAWGDLGVLSFGGSKLLTAGRGGALLTNDAQLAQRAKIHAQRGNDAFPLSELQAAVLVPQWERLDERNAIRRESVKSLLQELPADSALTLVYEPAELNQTAFYKVALTLTPETLPAALREAVALALQAEGAPIDTGFRGFVKRSKARCRALHDLPRSKAASERTLLLHHPALLHGDEAMKQIATAIGKVGRHLDLLRQSAP